MDTNELMLKQVIHHLLANAVKYGEPYSNIEVFCRKQDEHLLIGIRYQGPTFLKQVALRTSTELKHKVNMDVVGLGLYISSLYVEAMNGSIAVESKDDITVYSISLPVVGSTVNCDERA